MNPNNAAKKSPWVTCLFTRMVLEALERKERLAGQLNFPELFASAAGFDLPDDPRAFLTNVANWVPVEVLSELLFRAEAISGDKAFGYHAARDYFQNANKNSASLFEILAWVLDDVGAMLGCAGLWGTVLTNFLSLQAVERNGSGATLLARFDDSIEHTIGGDALLRGVCEGFPYLYASVEQAHCIEELSQLTMQNIVREFPEYTVGEQGDSLVVEHRRSHEVVAEGKRVSLASARVVPLRDSPLPSTCQPIVVESNGWVQVLTADERDGAEMTLDAATAYKITKPGALTCNRQRYIFELHRIYNAPYSRFHFVWKEKPRGSSAISAIEVRQELARLLFRHLHQVHEFHDRAIGDSIERRRLNVENLRLREELKKDWGVAGLVPQSQPMRELYSQLRSVAQTDLTVLVRGETGTGKELVARSIHLESPRSAKRFMSVNCGALSDTLLDSELFGHERGAFTGAVSQRKGIFELADGGTLFLDEIGEVTAGTQVRLLRVLQEGELQRVGGSDMIKVNVRIVAATNKNLEALVAQGQFREDLYYRLNVFPLRVPPLRERADDIPLLVAHFLDQGRERLRKKVTGIAADAMTLLITYPWPGNVRQLENTVQRMMVVAGGSLIEARDVPQEISGSTTLPRAKLLSTNLKGVTQKSSELTEKKAISEALARTNGNVTQASRLLGVSRVTLQKKMKAYGLRDKTS